MIKLREGQRGFTLIELIIAITIAALITGGITYAVMQILTINTRASNHMVAVRQVQQAGKEVSKDVLQAQNVAPGGSAFLTLNWTVNNNTYRVRYSLQGNSTLKTLQRDYYVNSTLNLTTIVAEYIDANQTTITPSAPCSFPNCFAYSFNVTASVGSQSETRLYEIRPRPGS